MAEIIEVNNLLAAAYEPKRQFRWMIQIDGIDAFTARSASRPSITFDEAQIDYINTRRFFAGKHIWNPITLVLNDPIAPSASEKVMEWIRLIHEDITGRSGYHSFYSKTVTLQMLDPVGAVVEKWRGEGAWIQEANFGELDYNSPEVATISMTLRADSWIKEF